MTTHSSTIKTNFGATVLVLGCMMFMPRIYAQTYVSAPMTSTPAAGAYYSNSSIVLSPGFSFAASAGQSLQLYILPPDCIPLVNNFSAAQNYIVTSVPRIGGITNASGLANRSTCDVIQTVQYFDGLGRTLQTVQVEGSPVGKDLVQPFAYDVFGREAVKYLPYALTGSAVSDGSYKTDALTTGAGQSFFYTSPPGGVTQISTPVAGTAFEPSPLNRVAEQGAPGADWQLGQHTVKVIYGSNDATSLTTGSGRWARLYTVAIDASTGVRSLVDAGSTGYGVNQLYVTVSQDEKWTATQTDARLNTTEEYKDKEGRVVLKRTYNYTTAIEVLSTYYVYDDLGNLCFVLPPQANPDAGLSSGINQTALNNLCYQYTYDERNRMVNKQLPGKGGEEIVYNLLDQAVYSRDANQAGRNEWGFTKYDALGRVIMTGIETSNSNSRAALQSSVTNALTAATMAEWETPSPGSGVQGYSNTAYPNSASTVPLTVNYYDDYTFQGQPVAFAAPSGSSIMTRGLVTATKTAVLNTIYNTTPDMLWTAHYYDDLGRITQSYSQHYLGGLLSPYNYDLVANSYDFTNEITASTRQHYIANAGNNAATLKVTI
ncbi:MAG: DUF6443 domain-containing protein, partial [Sphingobacteriales bacterium]